MVRHTLRGAAQHVSSPREMLLTIHRALATQQAETFCTVCLVALPTESPGLGDLVISLGGHPPPLLRRRDGSVETVGTTGLLLGMIEPNLQDAVVPIEPGDTLLLYTDGFTDAPGTRAFSIDEMTSLLETSGDLEPGPLADAIRAGQRHRQPGGSDDDTALVIIRFGVANGGAEVAASRLR
jgi:serine phosphatase RsbU (regulator of sigma subunit)